jgi:hypothetical protein
VALARAQARASRRESASRWGPAWVQAAAVAAAEVVGVEEAVAALRLHLRSEPCGNPREAPSSQIVSQR